MMVEVYNSLVKKGVGWTVVDLSGYPTPPIAQYSFLRFSSPNAEVKETFRVVGENEEYPFNTQINNEHPVALKLPPQPKIEFKTNRVANNVVIQIQVGARLNI